MLRFFILLGSFCCHCVADRILALTISSRTTPIFFPLSDFSTSPDAIIYSSPQSPTDHHSLSAYPGGGNGWVVADGNGKWLFVQMNENGDESGNVVECVEPTVNSPWISMQEAVVTSSEILSYDDVSNSLLFADYLASQYRYSEAMQQLNSYEMKSPSDQVLIVYKRAFYLFCAGSANTAYKFLSSIRPALHSDMTKDLQSLLEFLMQIRPESVENEVDLEQSPNNTTRLLSPIQTVTNKDVFPHARHFKELYQLYSSLSNMKASWLEVSKLLVLPLQNIGATDIAEMHYGSIDMKASHPNDECTDLGRMMNSQLVFSSFSEMEILRRKFGDDLGRFYDKYGVVPWGEQRKANEQVPGCFPALTLALCYYGENDKSLIEEVGKVYSVVSPNLVKGLSAHEAKRETTPHPEGTKLPVRVAIISSHFRDNSVCRAFCPTIRRLAADNLHISLIFPPGNALVRDSLSVYVESGANETLQLPSSDIETSQRFLRSRDFDAIIYTDVNMNPFTTLLAYSRNAPTQIALWGHHGTSGLHSIDYYLVGESLEDHNTWESKYSEQLVSVGGEGLGVIVDDALFSFDAPEPSISTNVARKHRTYLIPQSLPKFHPKFDEALLKILQLDESGIIQIVAQLDHSIYINKLRKRWEKAGVDNERIQFLPSMERSKLLNLMKDADVALDPFPVGGGVTSIELINAKTPIVTFEDSLSVIRTTPALVRQSGCGSVVKSVDDYARAAIEHAHSDNDYCNYSLGEGDEDDAIIDDWRRFIVTAAKSMIPL